MRSRSPAAREIFNNPILVGTITILVIVVAVYLSYIAENGLPFIPTYNINVQVADGGELVKNAAVRIGGARVGQVLTITPEPADRAYPHPYAQLGLALQKSLEPLPANTHYQVRLSSVLGGQYVELIPGTGRHRTVPDGGTLTISADAAKSHNIPYVDLNQAFDVFGPKTSSGIRAVTEDLGNAFAGRGTQLNDAVYQFTRLIGPLQSLLRLLANPTTNLSGFIDGLDSTTAALAPVAPTFVALLQNAATTLNAADVPALGTTLDELPPTESTATDVLTNSLPVLREAATITENLKPAVAYLPTAARRLVAVLKAAPPTFRLLTPVSTQLEATLAAASALARDPAAADTFKVLGVNDLGTAGASAFVGLGAILDTVAQAQMSCNVAGLWVRNFASTLSEGNATGNWLRFMPITDPNQLTQASKPAADLHSLTYPVEDSSECEAGNTTYTPGQVIGDPPSSVKTVDDTAPPPGVLQEGEKAGLVP